MTKFTFVVEPYGLETVTIAETHKEARKKVWEGLTQEEQDNCEYIECVEVEEVNND